MTRNQNHAPVPKGILLLIGGKENRGEPQETQIEQENSEPMEILKIFLKLIGKKDCVIEIVTTATGDGELFNEYDKAFTELGVKTIGHIHHKKREEILKDPLVERLRKADGIFFSGGNQLKLTSVYGGTEFLMELKREYIYGNIVIGGTSAGAIAFSTPMIYAGNKEKQQIAGEIKETTGLEFLKDVCIDTHFVDRGRFVRMAQVIACNPTCIGIGIEEDTAMIVRNGRETEVVGSGIVIVIEGSKITDSNILDIDANNPIFIDNLSVKLLAKTNRYYIPQNSPPHL